MLLLFGRSVPLTARVFYEGILLFKKFYDCNCKGTFRSYAAISGPGIIRSVVGYPKIVGEKNAEPVFLSGERILIS